MGPRLPERFGRQVDAAIEYRDGAASHGVLRPFYAASTIATRPRPGGPSHPARAVLAETLGQAVKQGDLLRRSPGEPTPCRCRDLPLCPSDQVVCECARGHLLWSAIFELNVLTEEGRMTEITASYVIRLSVSQALLPLRLEISSSSLQQQHP